MYDFNEKIKKLYEATTRASQSKSIDDIMISKQLIFTMHEVLTEQDLFENTNGNYHFVAQYIIARETIESLSNGAIIDMPNYIENNQLPYPTEQIREVVQLWKDELLEKIKLSIEKPSELKKHTRTLADYGFYDVCLMAMQYAADFRGKI